MGKTEGSSNHVPILPFPKKKTLWALHHPDTWILEKFNLKCHFSLSRLQYKRNHGNVHIYQQNQNLKSNSGSCKGTTASLLQRQAYLYKLLVRLVNLVQDAGCVFHKVSDCVHVVEGD